MKKNIIIEDKDNKKYDRLNKDNKSININSVIEWFIYMIGYSIVLLVVSFLFESIDISLKYFGLYAFLGAVIIYILNKTIKPILIYFTMPITIYTYGLFYPVVNVIILYITKFILGSNNFMVKGLIGPLIASLFISLFNMIVERFINRNIIGVK